MCVHCCPTELKGSDVGRRDASLESLLTYKLYCSQLSTRFHCLPASFLLPFMLTSVHLLLPFIACCCSLLSLAFIADLHAIVRPFSGKYINLLLQFPLSDWSSSQKRPAKIWFRIKDSESSSANNFRPPETGRWITTFQRNGLLSVQPAVRDQDSQRLCKIGYCVRSVIA